MQYTWSNIEKEHYSRHLILEEIGEEGQQKLRQSKVLVIGAGGLGCPILQYLVAAGVGTIGVVDGDRIERSNLQRQILYGVQDIGKYKSVVAKDVLTRLNPNVSLKAYSYNLTEENALSLFEGYDIIVDGSDNFPTRYLVNDACVITKKPLVFGSIFKFQGQVSVFNYNNSATYRCLYPTPPEQGSVPNCSEIGVLGVLPGIIGGLQANEVLKLILGIGKPLVNQLLVYDALTCRQQVLNFSKDEKVQVESLSDDYHHFCGITQVEEYRNITLETYRNQSDHYHLLDVRNYNEYEDFNIGGIHIPLDELEERMGEIPNNKTLAVTCASGQRSRKAIQLLLENYYPENIVNIKDGLY